MSIKKKLSFISAGLAGLALVLALITLFSPLKIAGQIPPPELVLFLAASSPMPFADLSPYHHPVIINGDVRTAPSSELNRLVYGFQGGDLEIPDHPTLNRAPAGDLTIEARLMIPNLNLDQVVMQKGFPPPSDSPGYSRNYGFAFSSPASSGNPNMNFIEGGMTVGLTGLNNHIDQWNIYAVRIWKDVSGVHFQNIVNGVPQWTDDFWTAGDSTNTFPLRIGTGFSTQNFQVNPFMGQIDYVRIYTGFLPDDQLNKDPTALPAFPVPPNQTPIAHCRNLTLEVGEDCRSSIIQPTDVDLGSTDPDNDSITLSIDDRGPFAPGVHTVHLTVTDEHGKSDTCDSKVTVVDSTAPVITVSEAQCVPYGNGRSKKAALITVTARDNCPSSISVPKITKVEVFNNAGNRVNGSGIYEIQGNAVYIFPNGNGWTVKIDAVVTDAQGTMVTISITKSLPKC